MNLKDTITLVAQTESGLIDEIGIQHFGDEVLGINPELGLMVLARGEGQGESVPAYKSVEIMMDDMQLNLVSKIKKSRLSASVVTGCMTESLENINEYLTLQAQSKNSIDDSNNVDLAVVQLHQDRISCCSIGNLSCLKFSNIELQIMGDDLTDSLKLGVEAGFQPEIIEQDFNQGDIVFLSSSLLIQQLGLDFIRMTLSRFNNNLKMALRQINTRAQRNEIKHKPVIILCRKNQDTQHRRSWLDKLR